MYSKQQKTELLQLAANSIRHGLEHARVMELQLDAFDEALRQMRASFVTLNKQGQLRGCIGSLEARQALVSDVVHNAYAAAFSDPRFPPLARDEYAELEIHISVLSEPEPISASSEEDLLRQLRPGIDGLILEESFHRATFLPSVWTQLPTPRDFLHMLQRKAGLIPGSWSHGLRLQRYTTESFSALARELD